MGFWRYKRRFNKYFHKFVTELKNHENWEVDDFIKYQNSKLKSILNVAKNSPYYNKILSENNFQKYKELPLCHLKTILLLPKEILRKYSKELSTEKKDRKSAIVFKTSGTKGTPTDIYYTKEFHAFELAVPEARNFNWAGLNYKNKRVMIGVRKVCNYFQSKPPFWRYSPAENMAYTSIYHLSEK